MRGGRRESLHAIAGRELTAVKGRVREGHTLKAPAAGRRASDARPARAATSQPREKRTMTAGELCSRTVVFAERDMGLVEAARLMRDHHVGALVVVDQANGKRVPVGVLTDRDIAVAVVAKEVDARTLRVGEVMSGEPITVREQDSVLDALRVMRARGVRRVPVTDAQGALVGIL